MIRTRRDTGSVEIPEPCGLRLAKQQQSSKLRELTQALVCEGFASLNAQAKALGLSRSTAWTILSGRHKSTGLTPKIIRRILSSPDLPDKVREKLFEYIDEKHAGTYGHSRAQRRRFGAVVKPSNECLREQEVPPKFAGKVIRPR